MGIYSTLKEIITNKPVHSNGPVFYKEDNDTKNYLAHLEESLVLATPEMKDKIERDIKLLSYGISGEKSIAFELQNSGLPLIILHGLNLEHNGLRAQIDYLIITPKLILVIECKNLFGNLEINNRGEFIRELNYRGKRQKEGIYSPVTQNARHLAVIKEIRKENISSSIKRVAFEKYFDTNHHSVIVLANPKTVVNLKYAPKELKEKIIRSDQLITYISDLLKRSKDLSWSQKQMYTIAEFYLSLHKETTLNAEDQNPLIKQDSKKLEDLSNELKEYRLQKSREEGVKAYYIFTNAELDNLIEAMPDTVAKLRKVAGFGDKRCSNYGTDIIEMIGKYK